MPLLLFHFTSFIHYLFFYLFFLRQLVFFLAPIHHFLGSVLPKISSKILKFDIQIEMALITTRARFGIILLVIDLFQNNNKTKEKERKGDEEEREKREIKQRLVIFFPSNL